MVAGAPSNCRPAWLETQSASAPSASSRGAGQQHRDLVAAARDGVHHRHVDIAGGGRSFDRLVDAVAAARPALDDTAARRWAFHLWATVHGYVMLELQGMAPPDVGEAEELFAFGLGEVALR